MFFTKSSRSIRSIWQSQLRSALDACGLPGDSAKIPLNIALHRSRQVYPIAYRSAIAVQCIQQGISPPQTDPQQLARELVARLSDRSDFAVRISPPAWIDCHLTDVGLAQWLEHWSRHPIEKTTDPQQGATERWVGDCFDAYYVRARCCALLRLVQREGLIVLASSDTDVEIVEPSTFPWLDRTESLRLQHPAERSLIAQSIAVVDALETPTFSNHQKLAIRLSQAFEEFDRQCRILEDLKRENRALAIARSGLLAVAQNVLKCLFEEKFGMASPLEL